MKIKGKQSRHSRALNAAVSACTLPPASAQCLACPQLNRTSRGTCTRHAVLCTRPPLPVARYGSFRVINDNRKRNTRQKEHLDVVQRDERVSIPRVQVLHQRQVPALCSVIERSGATLRMYQDRRAEARNKSAAVQQKVTLAATSTSVSGNLSKMYCTVARAESRLNHADTKSSTWERLPCTASQRGSRSVLTQSAQVLHN